MATNPDMLRGVAEPIVLRLVADRAMYGYEIIKTVNERTNGEFEWKEGTLYPCLHRLENAGWIRSDWQTASNGRRRKYYRITRRGQSLLKRKTVEWTSFSAAVNMLLMGAEGAQA